MIRRLDADAPGFAAQLEALLAFAEERDADLPGAVAAIIEAVRTRGDAALLEYTCRFDRRALDAAAQLEVPAAGLAAALARIDADLRSALEAAAARIEDYHRRQLQPSWEYVDAAGTRLGQRVQPIRRAGIYVPGGKASYPSTVLMNAIPARVAGVGEIVMVVPAPDGVLQDVVLAAARIAGVDRVFGIGGAQAVAALAFGTATVPRVDKIVGPGNRFVAEAKRQVFGRVGIDMIAGPSEVVVICDGATDPDWICLDLFSQAEHDESAQAILISPDAAFLDRVEARATQLLATLERAPIIARSLADRGAFIHVRDLAQAAAVSNLIAPEHLELSVADPDALLPLIRHAGAIFLGRHTPEAVGDYCAGPSHVLPTAGTARFSSPLGVQDFQTRTSLIGCTPGSAPALARIADRLARAEGLQAHALSAAARAGTTPGPETAA